MTNCLLFQLSLVLIAINLSIHHIVMHVHILNCYVYFALFFFSTFNISSIHLFFLFFFFPLTTFEKVCRKNYSPSVCMFVCVCIIDHNLNMMKCIFYVISEAIQFCLHKSTYIFDTCI